MKSYKVTISNHIDVVMLSLGFVVIPVGMMIYFHYTQQLIDVSEIFFIIPVILFGAPALYLHLEYYFHDKDCELQIDQSKKEFTYSTKYNKRTIPISEIEKVVLNCGPLIRPSSGWAFPLESYHFATIYYKENDSELKHIVITSFLEPYLENICTELDGVPIKKDLTFFASIYFTF